MGADNWAICPKCKKQLASAKDKAVKKAAQSYGVVSVEAFGAAMAAASSFLSEPEEPTLREDYEIGISAEGKFYISYESGCGVCGFCHKFSKEESLPL